MVDFYTTIHDSDNTHMSREEVFAALKELGVETAVVAYHGSDDESFVEEARLYEESSLNHYATPKYTIETYGTELGEALVRPIFDQLGEGFGDAVPGVDGVLYWKVSSAAVVIEHSYLDWYSEQIEA